MNTWIIDSGNVSRKLADPWVIDSAGVARKVKKIWVIDSGNIARLVFLSNIFTLTSSQVSNTSGYAQGSFGSLAPSNVLTDSNIINEIASSNLTTHNMVLSINKGSSGPSITSAYLTSLTINGTVFLGSSASFSGGGANGTWTWSSGANLETGGNPYTLAFAIT
jgi:hypothetical protein